MKGKVFSIHVLVMLLVGLPKATPQGIPNFIAKFGSGATPTANSVMFDNGTNVGVGSTDPQGKLDVSGNVVLNGNVNTQLSASGNSTVIKGSPIVLDLSPLGGGQLQVGSNSNDNKIFLEGLSSDGTGNASEMLITGRSAQPLPLFSILADTMRLLGTVQVGENPNSAFAISPTDGSPNAGYIRFGDNTGWNLRFGRSRESGGAPLNSGTTGVLMTIQDRGNVGIGTLTPTQKLEVAGIIRSSSGGVMFPDGTLQATATLKGPQGAQGPPGPVGPPTKSIAVCQVGGIVNCACTGRTITRVFGACSVTSDTGPCSDNAPSGCCAVCAL
jgi:hypothetical protein